jgi:Fuc2NAc and GlcNAc transferase
MDIEIKKIIVAGGVFAMAWGVAAMMSKYAGVLRLIQQPIERSSHSRPTPSGGGIGIALAGICGSLIFWPNGNGYSVVVLWLTSAAALIGILDDRFEISPKLRITAHTAISIALLYFSGFLPPISIFSTPIPPEIVYAIALLAGVWWINLFNFMDGIDGIAASEAAFLCLAMALLSSGVGAEEVRWINWWSILLACACFGFLVLNWAPARIFMGDAGSNYIAVAVMAIAASLVVHGALAYSTILVLGAAFISDATITLTKRVFRRESVTQAHRTHAYQKLARFWDGHREVTLLYGAYNVFWLLPIAYLIETGHSELLLVLAAYLPAVAFCLWARAGEPTEISAQVNQNDQ